MSNLRKAFTSSEAIKHFQYTDPDFKMESSLVSNGVDIKDSEGTVVCTCYDIREATNLCMLLKQQLMAIKETQKELLDSLK